jgi:hypothetical protein
MVDLDRVDRCGGQRGQVGQGFLADRAVGLANERRSSRDSYWRTSPVLDT